MSYNKGPLRGGAAALGVASTVTAMLGAALARYSGPGASFRYQYGIL